MNPPTRVTASMMTISIADGTLERPAPPPLIKAYDLWEVALILRLFFWNTYHYSVIDTRCVPNGSPTNPEDIADITCYVYNADLLYTTSGCTTVLITDVE
jgi:hypothetical protein